MKLNKGKLVTILAVIIFVIVFFMGRNAESAEVGVGLGFGTFKALGVRTQEISVSSNDYRWFASFTRIGKNDNTRLTDEYNNRFTAAYRVFWRRDARLKPYMSLGIAYFHNAPNSLISENLTYDMRVGVRLNDYVEVDIDGHNSTAGRSVANAGFDTVNLRAVFRFD